MSASNSFLQPLTIMLLAYSVGNTSGAQSQTATPEQRFFDWTELQFPKEEYAARRMKLMELLTSSGGDIYLTPSGDGISHGETFRQLDDFNYFTGLELPNSMLAIDAESNRVILFTPKRDTRFENTARKNDFPGRPLADDPNLKVQSGIDEILPMEVFHDSISQWIRAGRLLRVNYRGASQPTTGYISSWTENEGLLFHIKQAFPNSKIESAFEAVASLRMVKSPQEVAVLREAVAITASSIRETAKIVNAGISERSLEATLEAEF